VLAIASLGFAMLSGRLPVRRGLTSIFGCFILFGAPTIAHGIAGMAQGRSNLELAPSPAQIFHANFSPLHTGKPIEAADPYAGASVRN
jgi:hypothetical protein